MNDKITRVFAGVFSIAVLSASAAPALAHGHKGEHGKSASHDQSASQGESASHGHSSEHGRKSVGDVTSFDPATGALVVTAADGTVTSYNVAPDAQVKLQHRSNRDHGDSQGSPSNGCLGDVLPGASVLRMKLDNDLVTKLRIERAEGSVRAVCDTTGDDDATDDSGTDADDDSDGTTTEPADDSGTDSSDPADDSTVTDPITDPVTGAVDGTTDGVTPPTV